MEVKFSEQRYDLSTDVENQRTKFRTLLVIPVYAQAVPLSRLRSHPPHRRRRQTQRIAGRGRIELPDILVTWLHIYIDTKQAHTKPHLPPKKS